MDDLIYKDSYHPTRKTYVQNYIGKKLGRLTVLGRVDGYYTPYWRVKCDCGTTKDIQVGSLINSGVRSCGCLQREIASTHGLSDNPIYRRLLDILNRCNNSNVNCYDRYGGKGIRVCSEWNLEDPSVFISWALENGYEDDLEIDRIDPNDNYCPENCRWVTRELNSQNKNKYVTNKSGYTGLFVTQWGTVQTSINGVNLGNFPTKKAALEVRNNYIRNHRLGNRIQEYVGE